MVHTRSKGPKSRSSAKEDTNCNSLFSEVPSRSSKRRNDVVSSDKSSKSEKCCEKDKRSSVSKTTEKPSERPSRRKERARCLNEPSMTKEAANQNKKSVEKGKTIPKRNTRSASKKGTNRLSPAAKELEVDHQNAQESSCESLNTVSEVILEKSIKQEPEIKAEPTEPGESSHDNDGGTTADINVLVRGSKRSKTQILTEPMLRIKSEPRDAAESDRPQLSDFSIPKLSTFFSATALSSERYRDILRIRSGKRQLLLKIIEDADRRNAMPEAFANKNWPDENFFTCLNTAFIFGELTRDANFLEYQQEEERMACVGLTRRNYAEKFQALYAKHKIEANEAYTTERKRSRRRGPVPDYSELASGLRRIPRLESRASGSVRRNGGGNNGANSRNQAALAEGNSNNNSSSNVRSAKSKSASHSSAEGLSRGGRSNRSSNRPSRCPSPAEPDDDETDNCELSDEEEVLLAVQRETAAELEADEERRPEQRQRRKVAGMGNFMKWKYCYSDDDRGKRTKRRKPSGEEAVETTPTGVRDGKRQKLAIELSPVPEQKSASEGLRAIKRKALKDTPAEPGQAPTPAKTTPSKTNEAASGGTKPKKEVEDPDLTVLRTKRVLKEEAREEGEVCVATSSRMARLNELNSILRQLVHSIIKNPAQMEFTFDPPKVRLRNITPDQFCDIVQESANTPFMVHNASTTPVANPNGPGLGLCYHAHMGLRNEDDKSHDVSSRTERIPSKLPNIRPKVLPDCLKNNVNRSNLSGASYKSGSEFVPRQRKLRAKIAPRKEALPTPSHVPAPVLQPPPSLASMSRQPPQLAPKPSAPPMPGPPSFDMPGPSIFPRKTPIPRPVPKEADKPPPGSPPPIDAKETPSTSTGSGTGRILVKATCFQPRRPQAKLEPLEDINSDDSDQLALDADLKHRIISEVPLNSKSMTDSRGLRDAMRRMGRRKTDPDIHPVTRRMNKKVVRKMYTGSECVPSILKRPLNTGPTMPPSNTTSLSPLRPSSVPIPNPSVPASSMRPTQFPRVEYRRPVTNEYRFGSPLKVQLDNRGRYVDPYKPAERHEETPATALTASERLKLKKFNSDEKAEKTSNQQKTSTSAGGSSGKSSGSKNEGPAVLARSNMTKRHESGEDSDFELSETHHTFKSNVSPPSSSSSGSVNILTPVSVGASTATNPTPAAKVTPPGPAASSSSSSSSSSGSVHVKILPKPDGSPARSSTLSARPLIHDKATTQGGFRRILPRPENAVSAGATGACNGVPNTTSAHTTNTSTSVSTNSSASTTTNASSSGGSVKVARVQEAPVVTVSNADTQNITTIQRRPLESSDSEPPNVSVSPQKHQECQMALLKAILRQKGQMNVAGEAANESSGPAVRRISAAEAPNASPRTVTGGLSSSSSAGSLRVPPASSYTNPPTVTGAQSPRSNSQQCFNPIRIRMTRLKTPGAFAPNEAGGGGGGGGVSVPLAIRASPEENDSAGEGVNSR